jgi:type II secretory pathway pseudopilin PulG
MNVQSNLRLHRSGRSGEHGYILLALLLVVALMVIVAGAMLPTLAMQIRRDREDELIHREMQYRRAIRRFIKQTGRYPMNLEDLDKGQVRYLRKRYKDPITGKDFKLLHMLDIPQSGAPILNPQQGANTPTTDPPPGTAANQQGSGPTGDSAATDAQAPQPPNQDGTTQSSGQPANPQATGTQLASAQAQGGAFGQSGNQSGNQPGGNQPIGGGLIVGVASTSNKTSIREFNHKNKYNQWLFYYDPAFDRGPDFYGPTPTGLPQNGMFGAGGIPGASTPGANPGQPGSSTTPATNSPFGSSFGQPQSPQNGVPQQTPQQ